MSATFERNLIKWFIELSTCIWRISGVNCWWLSFICYYQQLYPLRRKRKIVDDCLSYAIIKNCIACFKRGKFYIQSDQRLERLISVSTLKWSIDHQVITWPSNWTERHSWGTEDFLGVRLLHWLWWFGHEKDYANLIIIVVTVLETWTKKNFRYRQIHWKYMFFLHRNVLFVNWSKSTLINENYMRYKPRFCENGR